MPRKRNGPEKQHGKSGCRAIRKISKSNLRAAIRHGVQASQIQWTMVLSTITTIQDSQTSCCNHLTRHLTHSTFLPGAFVGSFGQDASQTHP